MVTLEARNTQQTAARGAAGRPGVGPVVSARRNHRVAGIFVLTVLTVLTVLIIVPSRARAQLDTIHFLTLKTGYQTPSGDNIFEKLENEYGELQEDRKMKTTGIELDIYGASRGITGMGLGVDIHTYQKTFHFRDPDGIKPEENLFLKGFGVMFTFKAYLRLNYFYPFIGGGLGNYYVNYRQEKNPFLIRETLPEVYTFRTGFRSLLGRFGVLFEGGYTKATAQVKTPVGSGTLEMGGVFYNLGLSWLY